MQFSHRVAHCLEGAADLAIAAFVHADVPARVITLAEALKSELAAAIVKLYALLRDDLSVQRL